MTQLSPISHAAHTEIKDKADYHAVIVGRQPGVICRDPVSVSENTKGVPGGIALKFYNETQARQAYAEHLERGEVIKVTITEEETLLSEDDFGTLPGTNRDDIDLEARKYHIITVGRIPGIFPGGYNVSANIVYIPNAHSESFRTYDDAVTRLRAALANRGVKRIVYDIVKVCLTK